jgi:acetyl-CoA synthetase
MAQVDIESVLKEDRVFDPPKDFSAKAHLKSFQDYETLYQQALDDPEGFWASMAKELDWFKPWEKVLEWNPPFAKWFVGARTNIAYNCLDRHLTTARKNKAAIIWEGEPGDEAHSDLSGLHREVCKFANAQTDRREHGRSCRHLYADGSGVADCYDGLRPHRRYP